MKNPKLKNILFLVLFPLALICYPGVFLSFWNNTLRNSDSWVLPIIFMLSGVLCLILIFWISSIYLFPKSKTDIKKPLPPSENLISESSTTENQLNDFLETTSDLLKGISGINNNQSLAEKIMKNLAEKFDMVQGMFFLLQKSTGKFHITAKYAISQENDPPPFIEGEGLSGQAVADQKITIVKNLPDSYSLVQSGLGKGKPSCLYIIPLLRGKVAIGVIEMSTFREIDENGLEILNIFSKDSGKTIAKAFSRVNK